MLKTFLTKYLIAFIAIFLLFTGVVIAGDSTSGPTFFKRVGDALELTVVNKIGTATNPVEEVVVDSITVNNTLNVATAEVGIGGLNLRGEPALNLGTTTFYDPDQVSNDPSGYLDFQCTTCTDGDEDVDATLSVVTNGVKSDRVFLDGDGANYMYGTLVNQGDIAMLNGSTLRYDTNNEGTCINGTPDTIEINLGLGNNHFADQEDAGCEVSFVGGSYGRGATVNLSYAVDSAWTFASGAMYLGATFDESNCNGYNATRSDGDTIVLDIESVDGDTVKILSCWFYDI